MQLALDFDNFSAFVETAVSTNSMGELQLAALSASAQCRGFQLLNVGTSFVSAGSGYFSLRYCHVQHSFILFLVLVVQKVLQDLQSGVDGLFAAPAGCLVKVGAANGAQTLAILAAQRLDW